MEFLKWYLIIGVTLNAIQIVYNITIVVAAIEYYVNKHHNVFKLVFLCCGTFAFQSVLWLPLAVLDVAHRIPTWNN